MTDAAPHLRGPAGTTAGPWLRVLGTATLVVVFVAWGVAFAVGAESMFLLSRHVGQQRTDAMASASVVLTLVGAAVLLARHRRPLLVAGTVAVLAAGSLLLAGATNGYELAIGAALFTVAAACPPRTAWLLTAAVVVPVLVVARAAPLVTLVGSLAAGGVPGELDAVGWFRLPGQLGDVVPPWWIVTALPVVVLALFGVAFGTLVRTTRLRTAALEEAAAARAAEQEQRARFTQADERARVAREMHDVIAHSITVMVALGGGAAAALDRSPEHARHALEELVDTGRGALEDVRRILGVLHTPAPGAPHVADGDASGGDVLTAPQPGVEDLDRLVDRFRTAGLPVRTSGLVVAGLDGLDPTAQLTVYRVVQESLTNTLRHAPGTAAVDVVVRRAADALEVVVADRGAGPDAVVPAVTGAAGASRSPGRGITGMAGRVDAFGGTLEAGPHGDGWRVRAVLPGAGAGATRGVSAAPGPGSDPTTQGEA
ncbi:sensor histidine kinase [Cellulomonas fimi]|uniref:histidine kinase n=1 Tax=Cellulomonas fimi (strain ATCC 484 / DSM 20113 / JCM 1341 / CCUG 24087 / LMG 16345 / NBRC 15513 / NCIMB 8980 / NCTC 7547 / NRS-133) TaxID=590998 RepID=F4H2K0_CELFA|nr:histidine kinase [Cellulomonas fimi]AEE45226.1 integral membrane sensor signal transduction histidine kinase [Cellulomonas fimi ATCC 484]NNH07108.1 two-component sensor histidine kinase [Cellulomonas fimi]VEH28633.1 sensory histidine kinase UhpB [Cellulomonas fimi]